MILGRYELYDGHMPYRLPVLYVCAECGGEIRVYCEADGGYSVVCRTDERHECLKSRTLAEQEAILQTVANTADNIVQLDSISKLSPEVKGYVDEQHKSLKKELFGEG